jgi:hypothetical protein
MTLQEIVNRIRIEMLAEEISTETVDRVMNRIIYGHPDGLNAEIEVDTGLDLQLMGHRFDEWPPKPEWTPGWPPQDSDDMR